MKLAVKLSLAFVAIGIISSQVVFWNNYLFSKQNIKKETFNKLTAIRESKKREIENYFSLIQKQILTLSESQVVLDAVLDFRKAFQQAGLDQHRIQVTRNKLKQFYENNFPNAADIIPTRLNSLALQNQYIASNPFPKGSKHTFNTAGQNTLYDAAHEKYHSAFRNFIKRYGFYDFFLVDTNGDIIYTVEKEIDFATSLTDGPFKDTNIGDAFRQARTNSKKMDRQPLFVDFKFYLPSLNAPAAFIAEPLYTSGQWAGVLILQLPINQINSVMTGNGNWFEEGLGQTGETYIVGEDYTMRNDSRFLIESPDALRAKLIEFNADKNMISSIFKFNTSVLFQNVRSAASLDALAGNSDTRIIQDYRNIAVLSSYTPLEIKDLNWVLLSEIDVEEAFAAVEKLKWDYFTSVLVLSVFIIVYALFYSKKITQPLNRLMKGINTIKDGDLTHQIHIQSNDEFSELADTFNEMADNLKNTTASKDELTLEIEQRKAAELEKEKLIAKLQQSLSEIKTLQGILPLCSFCKKIRDDKGYWERVDVYIHTHSEADISHSICPDCMKIHYPDITCKQ